MLIKNHTIQNITVKYTSAMPDNVVLLLNSTDGINLPTNIIIYYPPLAKTLIRLIIIVYFTHINHTMKVSPRIPTQKNSKNGIRTKMIQKRHILHT